MRLLLPLLMLSACAEEAPASLDGDWELAAEELPLDEAGPPPVAVTVERMFGTLSPNMFFVGRALRFEAPVVRGAPAGQRSRCAWEFAVSAVLPLPVPPPGASWAFNVQYTPLADQLLWTQGRASVCSAAVFPAGVGLPFREALAWDVASSTLLHQTAAGWVPMSAFGAPDTPVSAATGDFDWHTVLRAWP